MIIVLSSVGYSWDFNLDVLRLSEQPPLPNVIVTNYALAHRIDHFAHSKAIAQRTEYQYWTELRNSSLPKPKFQFFQNARECHGRHTGSFIGNSFRRISDHLKHMYAGLNFTELDEFQLTAGRFDIHNKHSDGWHFGGTGRQMEVVVLMNMICNEWLEKKRSA